VVMNWVVSKSMSSGGRENGQALVLFAAGLVGFLAFVGLSIDVGHRMWARTDQQKAADAAALAAINKYLDTGHWSQGVAEAHSFASQNGYPAGQVTVNHPPLSGPNAGNPQAVEVIIEKPLNKYFIGLVYPGEWKTSARAVAKQTVKLEGFGVIALHPTECAALDMDSNAQINVTGGGVFVNSNCAPNAMNMDSNASAIVTSIINVHGEHQGSSNAFTSPAPIEHGIVVPDPFADVPVPPKNMAAHAPIKGPNGANLPNAEQCSAAAPAVTYKENGWYQFFPGHYPCQITFSSNASAVFMPGNYYFAKGFVTDSNNHFIMGRGIYYFGNGGSPVNGEVRGLWSKSNGKFYDVNEYAGENGALPSYATLANLQAGVLLYNGCTGACGNSGSLELNSNTVMKLTPYGDPYLNLLIWQDRLSPTKIEFNSNTHTSPGAIYAANAVLDLNSNANAKAQFVAKVVHMDSNAKIIVEVTDATKVAFKTYAFVE
jgi:Putative Flp pilus-assembly TadE/G-like